MRTHYLFTTAISLLAAGGLHLPATPVRAAQQVASEPVAASRAVSGLKLPAKAERITDAATVEQALQPVRQLAGERGLKVAATEVLAWPGGEGGMTDAAASTIRQQAKKTLEAAGFGDYTETPPTDKEGNQVRVIAVTDSRTRRALLGYWLQNDTFLMLAWARVESPASETPAPSAPAPAANALEVKDTNDAMADAPAPKMPAFPPLKATPGVLRGTVKDLTGKPLAGVKIGVEATAVGGFTTSVSARTDEKGYYEVDLPQGACRVMTTGYTLRYNGKRLNLPVAPADGECEDFSARKGEVENFVLRTWGVADPSRADQSPDYSGHYYGGSVQLQWWTDAIRPGGTWEATLTPDGPLADGTAGRALVFRFPNQGAGMGSRKLNDIPVGRYRLRLMLRDGDKAYQARLAPVQSDAAPAAEITVDFPARGGDQQWVTTGGTEPFRAQIKP